MQETPSSLTMDNPNSKKRNADGEAIGGVHTANDSRKTDSMVPAPGEDDTSQPPLKRRKPQHFCENNGRMNDTLRDSAISNKSPECSQSFPGDTGLDKGAEECITVQVSTFIAAGAPPTESSTAASDTKDDASVDSQVHSKFRNATAFPVMSNFVHSLYGPSSSRTVEDIKKVAKGQDAVETRAHSILSPSLPCNQIEGQSPPLSRREVPTSTQECHDGWKTFFEAISPRGKTYDEESGEGKGDAILPSSWNNTPVEEGAKTV
ncbi:hypothetical protein FPOA_12403 [Fusarium poae]|uniref:Uncharacterized protein n=1 Tax=Fusarium poae TaxID=36050 RepID=A0A1B8A9C2_FUSPO|nr:hypothetical protein FPOA_12409 [Fusarium poae]OBS17071.1 hypothetical protein FPOA_12403 [Fusarium poae]